MRLFLRFVYVALFLVCRSGYANALTGVEIAKRADGATVLIHTKSGLGSGFFVTPNLIVTNLHVVHGVLPSDIVFKRVGQEKFQRITSVRYRDRNHDLAVLRVLETRVRPLYLGDSDTAKKGETVYVAGNPRGVEATVSKGIISGQLTSPGSDHQAFKFVRKGVKLIQIDAPISSGSSGGPVINDQGEVIGIATIGSVIADAQNLNFAIPSKHLKALLTKHGVRLPPKPKSNTGGKNRENKERTADVEKAKLERAKAEAKKSKLRQEKLKLKQKKLKRKKLKRKKLKPENLKHT